jgi:Ca-activated chloride channel homolog
MKPQAATTFLLMFLLAGWMIVPALSRPLGQSSNGNPRKAITREVDVVVLPVSVTDNHGEFVSGLTKSNFQVYENGQLQKISMFQHEDIPLTVGLVLDSSGSMGPNRSKVVAVADDFLKSSNPEDQIFVVNFNENVSLGLPPGAAFTSNQSALDAAVLRGAYSGRTALYDALLVALNHLQLGSRNKKALILISDGGDNQSRHNFQEVRAAARRTGALIYCIGIADKQSANTNPKLLKKLAKDTGGKAYFPSSVSELPEICHQIAVDLREQYTLTYTPSDDRHDGTYRKIRVKVKAHGHDKLHVRTRAGYFAPSPPPVNSPTKSSRHFGSRFPEYHFSQTRGSVFPGMFVEASETFARSVARWTPVVDRFFQTSSGIPDPEISS